MEYLSNLYLSYKRKRMEQTYYRDLVVLHQFPRALRAPSASPFCLKLETWMRMAKLNYANDLSNVVSVKGKMPWISLVTSDSLIEIPDSHFCIEFLSKHYNIDLNSNLNPEQKATARAFLKMTEESLYWILLLHRYVYQRSYDESSVSDSCSRSFSSTVKKGAYLQGYGRHTKEEVYEIGKADLRAINDFIGNKKYLFGDKVCDTDASLFGMLCQYIYHCRGPLHDFIYSNCPSILRYVETIKSEYWKDWNENIIEKI